MKRILFVDDESLVLQGLRRMLRPLRHEWNMSFADSGPAALETLAGDDFDVVVTDMRMPGMDGAQLLEQVQERHPQVARIVLSGHAEQSSAVRAAGLAHQFLAKPCDADELRRTVSRTCALRDRLSHQLLLERVTSMGQLPSIPRIFQAVREEADSPEPSIARIGEIVAGDMGMSAKILQLVNSAFFGLYRRIDSVAEATRLLGIDVIRDLTLSSAVFQVRDADRFPIPIADLWRDSTAAGCIARAVARHLGLDKAAAGDAAQAAILHQVGRVALAAQLPAEYGAVLSRTAAGVDCLAAEREVLGCGHPEVGGYLLGLWGMPDAVVEAVTFYREPEAAAEGAPGVLAVAFAAVMLVDAHNQGYDRHRVAGELARVKIADSLDALLGIAAKTLASEGEAA